MGRLYGVVDICMPDMKYGASETAHRHSHVGDYWEVNRGSVKEMHRQVGDLVLDARGIAQRGPLVWHLVLPGGLAGTGKVRRFLAEEVAANTYLKLVDQYHPGYPAADYPPLDRCVTREGYREALHLAQPLGLGLDSGCGARWGLD